MFSAGGIVTRGYSHSAYYTEARWTKDFFGSTIYIDDTSFSITLGSEAEYLLKIIQGMQVIVSYPAVMQTALNNQDGQASFELAGCFERGEGGFSIDQVLAFKYYYDSALKNNVNGAEKTAQYYENGIGTNKDIQSAKYWYEMAASLGSNSSQEVLNDNIAIQNANAKKDAIIKQKEIQAEQAEKERLTSLFTRSNYITGIIISIFALCLGGWLDGSIWGFLLQWAGIILPIIFTACHFCSLGKSGWYALSMLVPLVNIAVIVYLCIKKGETETKEYEEAIEKINNK